MITRDRPPQPGPAPHVLPVLRDTDGPPLDAENLWLEFEKDRPTADVFYKGRLIEVKGVAESFEGSDRGRTIVGLRAASPPPLSRDEIARLPAKERFWRKHGFPPNVRCYLADGERPKVLGYRDGDTVTLRGRMLGSKDADAWHGFVIELEECRFIKLAIGD